MASEQRVQALETGAALYGLAGDVAHVHAATLAPVQTHLRGQRLVHRVRSVVSTCGILFHIRISLNLYIFIDLINSVFCKIVYCALLMVKVFNSKMLRVLFCCDIGFCSKCI